MRATPPFAWKRHEVQARPGVARDGVGAGRAVLEELPQEDAARARHRRAAEGRVRDHLVQRRFRVVVELRVVGERALPVTDVGFVPQLPQPARRDVRVPFVRVHRPRADEPRPLRVVGRGIKAPAVEQPGAGVAVRGRVRGERLGHESELDERKRAGRGDGVHDPVGQRPVIDRVPGGVLGVDVGRSPLHRRGAITGVEKKVVANARGRGVRGGDCVEQRPTFGFGRVVDLVVTVKRPHPLERRSGRGCVDRHVHGRGCLISRAGGQREQPDYQPPGPAGRYHQVSACTPKMEPLKKRVST